MSISESAFLMSVRIGKSRLANESIYVAGSERNPKTLRLGSVSSTPSRIASAQRASLFDVLCP